MSEHISRATQLMGSVVVALSLPTVWLAALVHDQETFWAVGRVAL
jgi:hypothetical protein